MQLNHSLTAAAVLLLGLLAIPTASADQCASDGVYFTMGCDPEAQDTDCQGYTASVFVDGQWVAGLSYQDPMTGDGDCTGGRTYCAGAAGEELVYYDPYNTRVGLC